MMNSLELFAGAGGLGIGMHAAGFQPANVIEWNRYCCDTIRENKARGVAAVKNWTLTEGDVRAVDFREYEDKIDLVSGGPPCQPFSLGGRHKAHGDVRDMFPEAIRAVRQVRPQAFVFENVKGLTRASFRNYFEYVRLQLKYPEVEARRDEDWTIHLARLEQHHTSGSRAGLQYRVVTQILNAADFGVPQKRERVFFVGFRQDLSVSWHFPTPTHSQAALNWDQLYGTYWDSHEVPVGERIMPRIPEAALNTMKFPEERPWQTVRDALVGIPDPERSSKVAANLLNHRFQPGARSYIGLPV